MEPFTEFLVTKVEEQKIGGLDYKIYHLKDMGTEKKMPAIKDNFVVWIDDKPKEGKLIFDKFDLVMDSTILIQLLSTEELRKWLEKNKGLFTDPTANLIFITNMTRKEGNALNGLAGIEGLREIR